MTTTSRRVAVFLAASAALFAVTSLLDGPVYRAAEPLEPSLFNTTDASSLFRMAGFFPTWVLVSLALVLVDSGRKDAVNRPVRARGGLLLASVVLSGLVTEVLKLLLRRERPDAHAGRYVFRAFAERPFDSGNLALPSSHASIAFGAAFLLSFLYPRAAPVWLLLATGCAAARVLLLSHFLSDVTLSAIVAFACAWAVWAWSRRARAA